MAQIYSRAYAKELKISRREQLIMVEIDRDRIDTASSFVEYMEDTYGFSRSSTWYCLNRLKEEALVEFANRDEMGKPLSLTKQGLAELSRLQVSKNELVTHFSNSFIEDMQKVGARQAYVPEYMRSRAYALYR